MSQDCGCGWAAFVGGLVGFAVAFALIAVAVIANDQNVGKKYQECIALGAPADNCLKKYVIPDNQKGE